MQTQSNLRRVLILLGAFFGTALLAFVPSAAWLDLPIDGDPYTLLSVCMLKQFLTVLLLLIVPALWARSAHRFGVWALLMLSALAYGMGYLVTNTASDALYTLLLLTLPGAGLYALQKLRLNNFRTVLYGSVLNLVALFGYVCLPDLIANGNAYLPFRNVLALYERVMQDTAAQLGVLGGESLGGIIELITELKLSPDAIGVPILLLPAMAAALSNVLFSHLFNVRCEVGLVTLPPFSEWRCERPFVYLATGFALITYFLAMLNINGMDALSSVGMLLWSLPCALAGLSAVLRLSLRARRGWIFAIICCAAFLLPSFGMTALSMVGMIASLRRPMTDRKDGTNL